MIELPSEFGVLTEKQRAFVLAYSESRNATQAAIQAGYAERTANREGSRLLSNVDIVAAYDAYLRPKMERHGITADRTLQELADIAYAPWREFISIGPHEARLHLAEKIRALTTLAQILGLFHNDQREREGPHLSLHYHPNMSAEESRQQLLLYLRRQ